MPKESKKTNGKPSVDPQADLGVEPTGRLELTWRGKNSTLLALDEGRTYQWLDPSDYRVNEVRLLRDVPEYGVVGECHPDQERAKDNLLIRGDALHALNALTRLPEFAKEYRGKVRLVYIDPPFNTGQAFAQYDDSLEHSVWLTMMRDRLVQIRDLLAPDGSVWVHLDDAEVHYCRIVMDEVFGRANFAFSVVWERTQGSKGNAFFSPAHDNLLVYAKSLSEWKRIINGLPRSEEQTARYANPDNDPRGPWLQGADGTVSAPAGGGGNQFEVVLPSGRTVRTRSGSAWRFSEETLRQARREGRVYFGRNGDSLPVIKTYLSEVKDTVSPRSWWTAAECGSNQEAKRDHLRKMFPGVEPFATPKPERLLHRIISIATNPGEVVLDCFAGSGASAAVAHKMGRRWVAVEWSEDTLATFTEPRLRKVVADEDPGGVTAITGWTGGGGFRILDVADSMYAVDANGDLYLADWVAGDALAEAVCAQKDFGFAYEKDGIFCGRKNTLRLAVVDGLVTQEVLNEIVAELPVGQKANVAGVAITDGLKAGGRVTKIRAIPASLVAEHERSSALRKALAKQRDLEAAARKANERETARDIVKSEGAQDSLFAEGTL